NMYAEAFAKSPDDYYTGINAASKSVFLGEFDKAATIAKEVEPLVGTTAVDGDYWKTATIGEVLLIQKKYKEAAAMYQKAVDIAPTETGSHASTWKQANLLLEKLDADAVEKILVEDAFKHL
ncbi:MAG: hypothetical protein ACXWCZ_08690, partial [Flavisolibacter sp.]